MTISTPDLSPAERFARLIDRLRRAVADHGTLRRIAPGLLLLISARLAQINAQVAALVTRIAAGRYRRRPDRRVPATSARRRRPQPSPLPRTRAWLGQLIPETRALASYLQHLIDEPEMAALLDAAPQLRRLLRPLNAMLGLRPPAQPAAAPQAAGAAAARRPPPWVTPPLPPSHRPVPAPVPSLLSGSIPLRKPC